MKKEVRYYLEDTSRLKEISQSELDAWIAEMPFHQPLHLLADIKSEMGGSTSDENQKVYAAYFAEDYESISKSKTKKNNQRNKNTKQLAKTIDIQPTKGNVKEELTPAPILAHNLSDDTKEDIVEKEVAEELIEPKAIVNSDLANELLEEEIISEVLEEKNLEETSLISDKKSSISISDVQEEITIDKEEIKVEDIAAKVKAEPADIPTIDEPSRTIEKVDYSDFTEIISIEENLIEETPSSTTESTSIALNSSTKSDQKENTKKSKVKSSKSSDKKSKKKSKKKKKKGSLKKKGKDKDKGKEKDKDKDKKDKGSKKKKSKKQKEKTKKKKKDSKKGKDKSKSKKVIKIKDEAKPIVVKVKKGKITSKGKKKKKEKTGKGNNNVEYVIVDSPTTKNFKLDDYDGVSNYTSWLLEQESINENKESTQSTQTKMKKSKKKKSKKKKSKKLKIAVDSIKKQDSIISEPLANILALQGHKKKASKMYTKLAFVFPEKKEYFEEKIESLNKG